MAGAYAVRVGRLNHSTSGVHGGQNAENLVSPVMEFD